MKSKNIFRKAILLWIINLLLATSGAFAQPSILGTDFWVSFGKNSSRQGEYMNYGIRVATTNATRVWINYTNSPGSNLYVDLPAGTVYTYYIPDHLRNNVYASRDEGNVYEYTSNNSLHITSEEPISLYAFNLGTYTSDVTNVFPVPALGYEYYHLSYKASGNGMRDGYIVIAAENNTIVKENGTVKATLQKGEVFSHFLNDVNTQDFTGAHITADKPIAYFVSNAWAAVPETALSNQRNTMFQQLAPVNQWGKKFFVPLTGEGKERVRILASQNGTNITRLQGGTIQAGIGTGSISNLNAGQFVELEIVLDKLNNTGGCYIESDRPVAVSSYMMSWGAVYPTEPPEDQRGAPSLCWIPPIEQAIKDAAVSVLNAIHPDYSRLVHHNAIITTLTIDKDLTTMSIGTANPVALSGGTWYDHPASDYSFYIIPLTNTTNAYYFANPNGMLVYAYGTGNWESYHYTAGSGTRSLDIAFYVNDIYHYEDIDGHTFCGITNFNFKLETSLPQAPGTYLKWYINDVEHNEAQNKENWDIILAGPETYTIRMEYTDIDYKLHRLSTTFTVKEYTAATDHIIGRNATICTGESIDLGTLVSAVSEISNPEFRWYYSESGIIHLPSVVVEPSSTTTYYVSVEGDNHCESVERKAITVYVADSPATAANITGPADTSVCNGSSAILTATSNDVNLPTFQWYSSPTATIPFYAGNTYTTSALTADTMFYVSVWGTNVCEGTYRREVKVTIIKPGAGVIWTPEKNNGAADEQKQDWNNPGNWTPAVIPAGCHNVFIPGNSTHYPKLTDNSDAKCNDIYFIQGAELGRPDLLTYNRAYVQMNFGLKQSNQIENNNQDLVLNSNSTIDRMLYSASVSAAPLNRERWYMLSSPLRGVVTGDLGFGGFPLTFLMKFGPVSKDGDNYLVGNWTTPYTSMVEPTSSSITDGFAFYMYGYGGPYPNKPNSGDNDGCLETGSFTTLNDMTYLPLSRMGFDYGLREVNGILELPFFEDLTGLHAHRTQVYEPSGTSTFYSINDGTGGMTEFNKFVGTYTSVARESNNGNYRFITENHNGSTWSFPQAIYHPGTGIGGDDEFMVGNPYMSSIDMIAFLTDNSATLQQQYRLWNGSSFVSYTISGGSVVSPDPGVNPGYIAPMQGFFLRTLNSYNGMGNVATFNVNNISTVRPSGVSNLRAGSPEENILRIEADNGVTSSRLLIGYKENASDGFRENEDLRKLFSPYGYVPEIYALADDIPVDINFINEYGEITVPLGIKTGRTGDIRLTFTGMDNYFKASKIELVDARENRTVDLTGKPSYTYTFNHTETGIRNGRFSLRIGTSMTTLPEIDGSDDLKVYGDSRGIYVVSSSSDPVQQVIVYDFQGRKVYESESGANYYPMQVNTGHSPLIVKVVTKNGTKTVKLVISD